MVKCILISEQLGNIDEIETPLQQDMYQILKGPATFVGQYPDIDVVIMKCRISIFPLELNLNKLPEPFGNEQILGPILLVRMNDESEPEDFTLQEFKSFIY